MGFGSCKRKLFLYYGSGRLGDLLAYEKVVLQPDRYTKEELHFLTRREVLPIAYLSVGEDQKSNAPWILSGKRSKWGSFWVDPCHPEWVAHITEKVRDFLEKGFKGLFLDTLDTAAEVSRGGTLLLAKRIREEAKEAYLLANRGFALLPELASYIDGILFESFSTTHSPRYAPLPEEQLRQNEIMAYYLKVFGKELFSLDYANNEELEAFAYQRAMQLGLCPVISNKHLTRPPLASP